MNASKYRTTRFEVRHIKQEANAFELVCTERAAKPIIMEGAISRVVAPRTPPLAVHESAFTDDEMRQVHAVLELLEQKFASVYEAWESAPERSRELIAEAAAAETRLQAARDEHEQLEAVLAAKRLMAKKA